MKIFYRYIVNTGLLISVDDVVYGKAEKVFGAIFKSYLSICENGEKYSAEYLYYILDKSNSYLCPGENCSICDTDSSDWVFRLMKELEIFYSSALKCTVVHGSGVRINGKSILLVGERCSGKTTLTQYLTINKNGEYLNDDCIYIVCGSYIGFGMPLPMRSLLDLHSENCYIAESMDSDGCLRTLYSPCKNVDSFLNIDYIIFPRYTVNGAEKMNIISKGEVYNRLLRNIRAYYDMKIMYTDIKKLTMNSTSYYLEYSSCDIAYDILQKGGVF